MNGPCDLILSTRLATIPLLRTIDLRLVDETLRCIEHLGKSVRIS